MAQPPLFDFCWIKDFDSQIEQLSKTTNPENWGTVSSTGKPHPILRNYLLHTFNKIQQENNFSYSDDNSYCVFNTGLATKYDEEIYFLCGTNKNTSLKQKWYFYGFHKESDHQLKTIPKLPLAANYFSDPSELLFDMNLEIRANLEHIIDDNYDRFPDALKAIDKSILVSILQGSIGSAVKRTKRNYKTAIPQYFKGKVQLLLPLKLISKTGADLALVIEKNSNFYKASTILTLDMAYNNARLIARPDDEWLKPV